MRTKTLSKPFYNMFKIYSKTDEKSYFFLICLNHNTRLWRNLLLSNCLKLYVFISRVKYLTLVEYKFIHTHLTKIISMGGIYKLEELFPYPKGVETSYPVGIYLLKVNHKNTRAKCEICSKLIIKTPERRH